jgi:hypothetical protein
LEGEFAFRLGRNLPPRAKPYAKDEIADSVMAVAGAIEVVARVLPADLRAKGGCLSRQLRREHRPRCRPVAQ